MKTLWIPLVGLAFLGIVVLTTSEGGPVRSPDVEDVRKEAQPEADVVDAADVPAETPPGLTALRERIHSLEESGSYRVAGGWEDVWWPRALRHIRKEKSK